MKELDEWYDDYCYTESMGAKRSSLSAQRLSELENGILVKLRY